MRPVGFIAAAVCALALPLSGAALAAGAPKPSQLVTAYTVVEPCSADPAAAAFNRMRTLGAAGVPLAIPPKQVLVITHLELRVGGADANADVVVRLTEPPEGLLFETVARTSATGTAFVSADLPNGVAVRSGSEFCAGSSDGGTLGVVHGYFAKDR